MMGNEIGHGHVFPRVDGAKARCGGPGMCKVCRAEQALIARLHTLYPTPQKTTEPAPQQDSGSCKHTVFKAKVNVARLTDTGRFMADVAVQCSDCGVPMQFMGLEPGYSPEGAHVSLDGLELRIGIHPKGLRPNPLQELLGYTASKHN